MDKGNARPRQQLDPVPRYSRIFQCLNDTGKVNFCGKQQPNKVFNIKQSFAIL